MPGVADRDRLVGAGKAPVGQLRAERPLGGVGARRHQQARGVLVETVDQARTDLAAGGRPAATQPEQGVDEGAGVMARRRVDDHPCRLDHYQQIGVLVDNLERDRLRPRLKQDGGGGLELYNIVFGHLVGGLCRLPVDPHRSRPDHPAGGAAAQPGHATGQEEVQPAGSGAGRQPLGRRRSRYSRTSAVTEVTFSSTRRFPLSLALSPKVA